MNKILLFFVLIFLCSCSIISDNQKKPQIIECPTVFFSSENNKYINGSAENLDLEKISYKATLNNYGFVKECIFDSKTNIYNIELLILVEPINPLNAEINLPIFALMYDSDDQLLDKQYFRFIDKLYYNKNTSNYEITELIVNLYIEVDSDKKNSSTTIGFINIK